MNELTKDLMCIKLMSGVEIWIEREKAKKLIDLLGTTQTKFVEIGNEIINSANVEGIFNPQTMADYMRRKKGEWKCVNSQWHARTEDCTCPVKNEKGEMFIKGQGWMKVVS